MIDLERRLIVLGKKEHPIIEWAVWWMIDGLGLYPKIADVPTGKPVQAMPVALALDGMYEIIPPILIRSAV